MLLLSSSIPSNKIIFRIFYIFQKILNFTIAKYNEISEESVSSPITTSPSLKDETLIEMDEEGEDLDWDTDSLSTTAQNVTVENLVYSFSNRHYDINDGEIKATSEHPMLVKDASDGNYRFKEMFNISTDDKLIKEIDQYLSF